MAKNGSLNNSPTSFNFDFQQNYKLISSWNHLVMFLIRDDTPEILIIYLASFHKFAGPKTPEKASNND